MLWGQQRFRRFVRDSLPITDDRSFLDRLSNFVATTSLELWTKGHDAHDAATVVVLGFALYSTTDIAIVDDFDEMVAVRPGLRGRVFPIFGDESLPEMNELFPGAQFCGQSPIVEIWRDGVRVAIASGANALELLSTFRF